MKRHFSMLVTLPAVLLSVSSVFAQTATETKTVDTKTGAPIAPDNSVVNQRDRTHDAKTADHQAKSGQMSTDITRMIRRELTKDSSLSTSAHNIKIVTSDSTVVLRGPVKSSDEKTKIGQIAQRVASNLTIENDLEIKQ